MQTYWIICRSITFAQRVSHVLYRAGVGHQMLRLPAGLLKSGCGYAVQVREERMAQAMNALQREGLRPAALYLESGGQYQEVRYDLS